MYKNWGTHGALDYPLPRCIGYKVPVLGFTGYIVSVLGGTSYKVPVLGCTGYKVPVMGCTGYKVSVLGILATKSCLKQPGTVTVPGGLQREGLNSCLIPPAGSRTHNANEIWEMEGDQASWR
ncbi:hypothetical protein XELAEV_18046304mg [Xenopus laevis]|uniref:Uncharacterized protein n=1 Tax=Xenopus laevis TaxID=8355 RepID=A0A974H0G6_XENLA|nr:hypothetical protein XELAEV_18046304mg [Xenopus laevis]